MDGDSACSANEKRMLKVEDITLGNGEGATDIERMPNDLEKLIESDMD